MLVQAWIRCVGLRQPRRLAGLAVTLAIALSALTAGPASAIVVRLANGKEISYEAVAGSSGPSKFDDIFSNVDYNGGPVMPSNTNYVVAWAPAGYVGGSFQLGYLPGVSQFFTDLAHDSGQATNGDSVATQYNDASGQVAAYKSSFAAPVLIDTDRLPTSGCNAATPCITDAQIQSELSSFIASHNLPRDLTHEYFLLTPPNLTSCLDGSGSSPCSGNVDPQGYCAYHSASTVPAGSFIYANIPDLAGLPGCDPFASGTGFCPVTTCNYNYGNPAQGVLSAIDHEHAESLTDPQPNNAWTDWGFINGPEEMADKCNDDAFSDPNLNLQQSGQTATPYNYTVNGDHYLLQMMWSNQGHQCLHSFTPNGTAVHASFTQTASPGDNVSFDASASTPSGNSTEYVWQFNDGPGQQTNTFETNSPTTSNSFPTKGGYVVALTVMAPDGTSMGAAHTVFAVDSGPNPAFSPPKAYVGIPATFNGGSTTDPNPNSGITSYSWDFGDGTTGSGKTAPHTFLQTGNYTVTLTVQDNYFALASVSENVTVSPVPPASFVPRSGLTRQTIHFGVTGPIPPDTAYSWKFGDGGSGHGPHPTHRYARSGTYWVTLTITGRDGHRRTVTLRVRIRPSCRVPNVKGDSLARARSALAGAACRVGTITHHGHSHVTGENPHSGAIVALGRRVALTF